MAKKKKEVTEEPVVEEVKQEEKSIEEMSPVELKAHYDAIVEEFKKEVQDITDEEKLKELEQQIVAEYDEQDKIISERVYPIPESVVFNGTKYSRSQIGVNIRKLINKMEVDYRATLGMFQLYKLWVNPPAELPYGAFDSTLRILGQVKFKGFSEWESILAISEYFKECNAQYTKDTCMYDYLANKHQVVMSQMELTSGHTPEADALEGIDPTANMQ